MAETELKAGAGSGTQTTTQSPQTAGKAGAGGTRSSSLQPGTATSLLSNSTGTGGVPLKNQSLSVVDLGSAANRTSQTPATTAIPTTRDVNPLLIALPVLLIVMAALSVFFIRRSAKTTTL